jgi:hypothetical protein
MAIEAPKAPEAPPTRNGFIFFIAFAIAIAIVCLGVVVFSAQLPG